MKSGWTVLEHPDFAKERAALPRPVQLKLAEALIALIEVGPNLGRPLVDTLKASKHKNMKEIRLSGVWRFAFAFDLERNAVILVGGDKEGKNQKTFYKSLIRTADDRFDEWLESED